MPETSPGRRGRVLSVLVATLLTVATVALVAYYLSTRDDVPVDAIEATASQPSRSEAAPVRSLWFGDSIVDGCCRENNSDPTMVTVAAEELGWLAVASGSGGTGYLASGPTGSGREAFPDRIASVLQGSSYDVVIIAGGGNDLGPAFDAADFRAAVSETLATAREEMPQARLVLLSPYTPDGTGVGEARDILREEARRVEARFIDQTSWMRDRPDLLAEDDVHPNSAGQRYLGARIMRELRKIDIN